MLFTHLYLGQGEKVKAWFLSPTSRDYFGYESTAFLSASKLTKKIYPLVRWTAKSIFCISEAIKIAVSFSNFQCLYAMFLWDNSKHGFSVALILQSRN